MTVPVQSATEASTNTTPAPCGVIPSIAQAYSFNLTVVPQGTFGFLSIWPSGLTRPVVSTLNDLQGQLLSNAVIVPAGTPSGGVSVYNSGPGPTDVIIDMNGFFAAPTDLSGNTAIGAGTLASVTTGYANTATGSAALASNTTGFNNTAEGNSALADNTTGTLNTAIGQTALQSNTVGTDNTAAGQGALISNTTGNNNTGVGGSSLNSNSTGSNNTAVGFQALSNNGTGSGNIALGAGAAGNVAGGSNNIHIGNLGASGDANVIRIGSSSQTSFFASGIRTVTTGQNNAVPVLVDSNGQLGTISSSRRFKEDIQDMGDASGGLMRLRPVTFRYQKPFDDGSKPIQYGLIAEEVAQVFPDLVATGADGQAETVKYQLLDPILLNEVQRQHVEIGAQKEQIHGLEQQNQELQDRLARLEAAIALLTPEPKVP